MEPCLIAKYEFHMKLVDNFLYSLWLWQAHLPSKATIRPGSEDSSSLRDFVSVTMVTIRNRFDHWSLVSGEIVNTKPRFQTCLTSKFGQLRSKQNFIESTETIRTKWFRSLVIHPSCVFSQWTGFTTKVSTGQRPTIWSGSDISLQHK